VKGINASEALGFPPDYFPDIPEAAVISAIKTDPNLRDRLYDRIDTQRLPR